LKAFEKSLAASAPHHLTRLCLVASADDYERKMALDAVLSYVLTPDAFVTRLSNDAEVRTVLEALSSPALFSPEPIVVIDDADKKLLDSLAPHFKEPLTFGYLFIGAKMKGGAGWVDANGSLLDLTEEKPWDKEKRWTERLHEKARAAGKRLSPDAAIWMIERLERDAALLAHEMDKLLCYAASKSVIERADVEAICSASRTHALWAVAEEMVWDKSFRADAADVRESSFFHGLLASLRQQLMIGAKMHSLYQSAVPYNEWSAHFPRIWPKALEKKAQAAQKMGSAYFRSGLEELFEMELTSKSSAPPLDALLDLFRVRLIGMSYGPR
jgi:DNA polymerase III subunit delta